MYSTVQESALSLCMGVLWLTSCAFLMMRYFPGISSFCARLAPSVFFVYAAHALVYECMLRLGFPRGSFWIWGMAVPLVFLALSGLYFFTGADVSGSVEVYCAEELTVCYFFTVTGSPATMK